MTRQSRHAELTDRCLAAAADDHVRLAALNGVHRVGDVVVAGRAGGHDGVVWSAQSVAHRDESRGHVGNHHRYQKRRNPRMPFGLERRGLSLQSLNAADPAAKDHAHALTRIRRERVEQSAASRSASSVAATAYCAYGSSRRASLRSMWFAGSKPLTSQAKVVLQPDASNAVMGAAPLSPARR